MKQGDTISDFELLDQNGTAQRLSSLLQNGPVVLFFYPAAMTYGCTKESCHFRDMKAEFDELGAQRVGISADSVEKQKAFSDKYSFDYPLLSDSEYKVAQQLGVRRSLALMGNRRTTFVINTDQTLIGVIHTEVSMSAHANRALEMLKALKT